MKAPKARTGRHLHTASGPVFNRSAVRGVLVERIVRPIGMVIGHVFAKESTQVAFIQRNKMVEQLSATAPDPALRYPVLPRRLNARPLRPQTRGL